MAFLDQIRKLTHPYSDNDSSAYDDYDEEEEEFEEEPAPAPRRGYTTRGAAATETNTERTPGTSGPSRVMSISHSTNMQVVLVKPERFDQVRDIAARLRDKQSVVLNLESTNKDVARRLVDFLSGVAYAGEGKIKKVASNTYIITPYHVDLEGDLIDELENNGLYF